VLNAIFCADSCFKKCTFSHWRSRRLLLGGAGAKGEKTPCPTKAAAAIEVKGCLLIGEPGEVPGNGCWMGKKKPRCEVRRGWGSEGGKVF